MTISLLQLNISADNYFPTLCAYLQENDFDIITLQELAGKGTAIADINCTHDTFAELQKLLSPKYIGVFLLAEHIETAPTAYFGNAIFYKKEMHLLDKRSIYLKKNDTPFAPGIDKVEDIGRGMLHLTLQKEGRKFSILTTHFGWAKRPIEELHQTRQGQILLNYLLSIKKPFILTGDFNLPYTQPIIKKISKHSQNLTQKYAISNTLNPRTHRVKSLFPPGIVCDYIFLSDDLKEKTFAVIEDKDLSDHFALTAQIEI